MVKYSLVLVNCDSKNFRQRWTVLWQKHIVNRFFMKCLTVSDSSFDPEEGLTNGAAVALAPCIFSSQFQRWERVQRVVGKCRLAN